MVLFWEKVFEAVKSVFSCSFRWGERDLRPVDVLPMVGRFANGWTFCQWLDVFGCGTGLETCMSAR